MEEDPGLSGGGSGAGDLVSGSGAASRQARRRPLSTTQLSRKRQLDRAKKRVNRAEQKSRLESIERDVSLMRESIAELVKHLRKGKALSNPGNLPQAVDGPSMETVIGQLPTIQGSPASSTDLSDSEEEFPAHGDALEGMNQWQQTNRIQPVASHTLQHHAQHSQAGFPFRYGTQQSTASSGTAMPRGGTDILPYNSGYLPTSAANAANQDASWWQSGDGERQIVSFPPRLNPPFLRVHCTNINFPAAIKSLRIHGKQPIQQHTNTTLHRLCAYISSGCRRRPLDEAAVPGVPLWARTRELGAMYRPNILPVGLSIGRTGCAAQEPIDPPHFTTGCA